MASLNQDIIVHDLDRFIVRFTILDNEDVINGASARAWWGVATGSNIPTVPAYPALSSVKIQASNDSWTAGSYTQVLDYGGLSLGTDYIQAEIRLNNGTTAGDYGSGSIRLKLVGEGDQVYYHECVYSSQGEQEGSVVTATGTLTVKPSLFTEAGYRA